MDSDDDYAPGQWLSISPGDHIREHRGAPADAEVLDFIVRDLVRARDDLDELGESEAWELVQLALNKLTGPTTSNRQLKLAIGG